jgi:hypothetical protein
MRNVAPWPESDVQPRDVRAVLQQGWNAAYYGGDLEVLETKKGEPTANVTFGDEKCTVWQCTFREPLDHVKRHGRIVLMDLGEQEIVKDREVEIYLRYCDFGSMNDNLSKTGNEGQGRKDSDGSAAVTDAAAVLCAISNADYRTPSSAVRSPSPVTKIVIPEIVVSAPSPERSDLIEIPTHGPVTEIWNVIGGASRRDSHSDTSSLSSSRSDLHDEAANSEEGKHFRCERKSNVPPVESCQGASSSTDGARKTSEPKGKDTAGQAGPVKNSESLDTVRASIKNSVPSALGNESKPTSPRKRASSTRTSELNEDQERRKIQVIQAQHPSNYNCPVAGKMFSGIAKVQESNIIFHKRQRKAPES